MYRHLQSLAAFVAVGDTGAFVKAAKRLGVTPSVVSHHIARLEEELGEALVHRTTRKLSLSANGQQLYDSTRRALGDIELAMERAKTNSEDVVGALRVALPAFVPDPQLEQRVMAFAQRHSNVALSLDYTDHLVDLVDGGYDLAIRLGELPSSSLIRRKLGVVSHALVATPTFLSRFPPITRPDDLQSLPAVAMGGGSFSLSMHKDGQVQSVQLDVSQIKVESIFGARTATLAGLGFGNLPLSLIESDLARGDLVQILSGWTLPSLSVQAVWSPNSHRRNLADRFVRFLLDHQP